MSASTVNNNILSTTEAPKNGIQEDIEHSIAEDLPGVFESSGGSSELEALHLQTSTVTFTGIPSPQPSESILHNDTTTGLQINGTECKHLNNPSMHICNCNSFCKAKYLNFLLH